MKALVIALSITFLAAMSVFGQSIMVSPSILNLESRAVGDVGISAYRANNGGLPVTNGRVLLNIGARGEAGAAPNIQNASIPKKTLPQHQELRVYLSESQNLLHSSLNWP